MELYAEKEPRGEYVLVVEGSTAAASGDFWAELDERAHVEHYMALGMAKNDAIKAAARDRGVHKSEVYKKMI